VLADRASSPVPACCRCAAGGRRHHRHQRGRGPGHPGRLRPSRHRDRARVSSPCSAAGLPGPLVYQALTAGSPITEVVLHDVSPRGSPRSRRAARDSRRAPGAPTSGWPPIRDDALPGPGSCSRIRVAGSPAAPWTTRGAGPTACSARDYRPRGDRLRAAQCPGRGAVARRWPPSRGRLGDQLHQSAGMITEAMQAYWVSG